MDNFLLGYSWTLKKPTRHQTTGSLASENIATMERSRELSMDQTFLQSLKEIVLSNLENEQFGAEDLSREIGLSRSQVHRKLQKINGKSISQKFVDGMLNILNLYFQNYHKI